MDKDIVIRENLTIIPQLTQEESKHVWRHFSTSGSSNVNINNMWHFEPGHEDSLGPLDCSDHLFLIHLCQAG